MFRCKCEKGRGCLVRGMPYFTPHYNPRTRRYICTAKFTANGCFSFARRGNLVPLTFRTCPLEPNNGPNHCLKYWIHEIDSLFCGFRNKRVAAAISSVCPRTTRRSPAQILASPRRLDIICESRRIASNVTPYFCLKPI